MKKTPAAIHWFRKGLRLHDNPSLLDACAQAQHVYPVFVIDPYFAKPEIVGINRYNFLLQSLVDLDKSLKEIGSRLYVARGKPEEQIPLLMTQFGSNLLTFEKDTEPYAQKRDAAISKTLIERGCTVRSTCSHTLYEMDHYLAASKGTPPTTYQQFIKLFTSLGPPRLPVETVTATHLTSLSADALNMGGFDVPTLVEMGYTTGHISNKFPGGETEALRRLQATVIERSEWVTTFQKPETSPNSIDPSTTVLSPYLKFGCLSPALFYHELEIIAKKSKKPITQPPVSLHGQLLWREFFYLSSTTIPNFDKMVGNPRCRQIPWNHDDALYDALKYGRW